jgi:hypothetical protein
MEEQGAREFFWIHEVIRYGPDFAMRPTRLCCLCDKQIQEWNRSDNGNDKTAKSSTSVIKKERWRWRDIYYIY